MSILAARSDTLTALETAQRQLYGHVFGGAAFVAAALLAPKDPGSEMFRLALTVLFFLGLITVAWAAAEPLEAYLRARLELSLEDAGVESRSLGHAAIDALSRYLRRLVWPVVAALSLLFLRVLAAWPIGAPIEPVLPLVHLGFWIALAAIPVQLFSGTNQLIEIFSLWRSHRAQMSRSRFQPRTVQEARTRADELAGPPVAVSGPYGFRAGGMDWSWADFQKNAIVFGQTGSGKTVAVLNALLDGLLSSADGRADTQKAAALILDPKGDYREKIGVLCARLGRSGDLRILDPDRPGESVRWNPFDSADDALEISERFAGVLQLLGMKNTQDTFWIDTAKTFLRHAVGLLRATEPPDAPPSFGGINELATRPLLLEARLFVLHAKALFAAVGEKDLLAQDLIGDVEPDALLAELAEAAPDADALRAFFRRWSAKEDGEREAISKEVEALAGKLARAPPTLLAPGSEALLASEYLGNNWLTMPERTRGSVRTQLTTMIDPFLTEPYRTLFSGRSTVQLGEVVESGLIFYVYMPRDDRSAMSRVVNTLVKLEFYRQVLRRRGKSRPSLFFCDEFQSFFTSDEGRGDGPFFERSRESLHANLVATQNLSSLLRDVPKEETVHSFMGNCAVKMFLRNTEGKTNEYASKNVFGEYLGFITTAGRSIGDRRGHEGLREGASISVTAQTLPVVPPERLTQLAIPDPERGILYAEALVHLGSRGAVAIERLRFKVHPLDN